MTGCPFYGCALVPELKPGPPREMENGAVMVGSGGNQCALITSAHSPCWMMLSERREPDWAECPRNPEFVALIVAEPGWGVPLARFNEHALWMERARRQAARG